MKLRVNSVSSFKFLVFFFLLISSSAFAQIKNSNGGFLDFNLYPYLSDVETDSVFTLNTAAKLPNRFSYFSLINLYNESGDNTAGDTTTYYTEQNLRWQVSNESPFDLTMQLNFRTGDDNDRYRFGVRWRLNNTKLFEPFFNKINAKYAVNLHAIQFDHEEGNVWQLEHTLSVKFPYLTDRLYFFVFVDHTFNQKLASHFPSNPIVAEAQLGFEVYDNLFLITEYRLNEYRRSDVNNLALGLEYKIIW